MIVLSTICHSAPVVSRHCIRLNPQPLTRLNGKRSLLAFDKVCRETYLLQLHILQITSHHHLQHNKELPVADVSVTIDVIDLEGEPQFLFFIAFRAEGAKSRDKLLEVDIAASVFIKNGYHAAIELKSGQLGGPVGYEGHRGGGQVPGRKWIRRDLRQGEELVTFYCS